VYLQFEPERDCFGSAEFWIDESGLFEKECPIYTFIYAYIFILYNIADVRINDVRINLFLLYREKNMHSAIEKNNAYLLAHHTMLCYFSKIES